MPIHSGLMLPTGISPFACPRASLPVCDMSKIGCVTCRISLLRFSQRAALAIAACCVGRRNALRWALHRTALWQAFCLLFAGHVLDWVVSLRLGERMTGLSSPLHLTESPWADCRLLEVCQKQIGRKRPAWMLPPDFCLSVSRLLLCGRFACTLLQLLFEPFVEGSPLASLKA